MLSLTIVMLVVCALFAIFALKKLPMSLRAFIAFGDLAMALTIVRCVEKSVCARVRQTTNAKLQTLRKNIQPGCDPPRRGYL